MSVTKIWDETTPANSRDPKLGAGDIRDDKQAVRERMENGAHHMAGSGTDTDDGKHTCGAGDVESTGDFTVYEADKATAAVTVSDSTGTNADTVQLGDGRGGSNNYTLDAQTIEARDLDVAGLAELTGNLKLTATDVADNYTADAETVIIATITDDKAITLPAAAGVADRVYVIVNHAASTQGKALTITPDGSETVAGSLSIVLDKGESVIIQSDSSNWQILSIYRRRTVQISSAQGSVTATLSDSYSTYVTQAQYITASGNNNRVLLSFSGTLKMQGVSGQPAPRVDLKFMRDGSPMSGSEFIEIAGEATVTTYGIPTRVHAEYVDTNPTEGATHSYTVQMRTSEDIGTSTVDVDTDAPMSLTTLALAGNP